MVTKLKMLKFVKCYLYPEKKKVFALRFLFHKEIWWSFQLCFIQVWTSDVFPKI